jgi:hypothetical protein
VAACADVAGLVVTAPTCGYEWRTVFSRLTRHTHGCGRNFGHDADPATALHVCGSCAASRLTTGDIRAGIRRIYRLKDDRDQERTWPD